MISYEVSGSFENIERFLRGAVKLDIRSILEEGGREGVNALRAATPVDTGVAQAGWGYRVKTEGGSYEIEWFNANIENGYKVVIRLQYGHGTGTGGYVQGRDFINPAMRPVFDSIADRVWKAVTSL